MTEQRKNSYEDTDCKSVIDQYEAFDVAVEKIMAAARGEANGVRNKQKNLMKQAVDDLAIPRSSLKAMLDVRKLEKKIKAKAEGVNDDEVEVFTDMAGQFSFLKPIAVGETSLQVAARERAEAIQKKTDDEQSEGDEALNDLGAVH